MISTKPKTPKMIQPGNHVCKIHLVELEKVPYNDKAYHLSLIVEGPELKDFEGFLIDKNDPSKGKYKGQSGRVKADLWPFRDDTIVSKKTGEKYEIKRDDQIARFVDRLLKTCRYKEHIEGETIEDFINNLNKARPYDGKWFNMCIGGREYKNKEGYVNYDLFLPKPTKTGFPMELNDVPPDSSRLIKFDQAKHIVKKKAPEVVESFPATEKPVTKATKDNFSLE